MSEKRRHSNCDGYDERHRANPNEIMSPPPRRRIRTCSPSSRPTQRSFRCYEPSAILRGHPTILRDRALPRSPSPLYERRIGFALDYDRIESNPALRSSALSPASSINNSTSTSYGATNIRTSAITLLESNHGRARRMQRCIARRDIQEAIKYGVRKPHPSGDSNLSIYVHRGQKHVVARENTLVTTMVTTVELRKHPVYLHDIERNSRAMRSIHGDRAIVCSNHKGDENNDNEEVAGASDPRNRDLPWKSHSVLIVDTSGSMRNSDVNGCRTRLGAVWLSVAQDFIDYRIRTSEANDQDIVSVILMGENAKVEIDRWPTDKFLYNKIVQLFYDSEEADRQYHDPQRQYIRGLIRPKGHGCYLPSLKKAEQMIEEHDNAACALQVLLLSDGRPSDGRFFHSKTHTFQDTLKDSVGRMASKFGRRFNFAAIGMGNVQDYDCLRSMVASVKDFGGTSNLRLPGMSCADVGEAMSNAATSLTACKTELSGVAGGREGWKYRRVRPCLRESSKRLPILTEVVDESFDLYTSDKVSRCEFQVLPGGKKNFVGVPLQHPNARGVALKRCAFGEGQERLAFQFFEIAKDGVSVVGEPLVAKESRFVEDYDTHNDDSNWEARDKFATRFCKIQTRAKSCAKAFNEKLSSLGTLDPDTARVSFIDCCVYYLTHETRGEFSVIVEPRLQGRFEKWNNNNGWRRESKGDYFRKRLISVHEGNEENDNPRSDEDDVIDLAGMDKEKLFVSKNEVAQAFSHFSYVHSGRKMLICDLQGVFRKDLNLFCFTDPVIHYHDARKEKQRQYGRTDMGQKGIQSFFKSHKCNALCHLVTKGFINIS